MYKNIYKINFLIWKKETLRNEIYNLYIYIYKARVKIIEKNDEREDHLGSKET